MYELRPVENCTHEDIYLFVVDLEGAALLEFLSEFGTVERPVSGTDLVTMDEPEFVVSGNLDRGRFKLRIKAGNENSGVREGFERKLEAYHDG